MKRAWAASLWISAAALVSGVACQPIDPGGFVEPSCEETTMAEAPSGLSADFVGVIAGARSSTLDYLGPPDEGVYVEIAREADSSVVEIEFVPQMSTLRWVEAERVDPDGLDPDDELPCDSRFEVDGTLSFTSADGIFAEAFETTVVAPVDADGVINYAAAPVSFEPAQLAGSFEVLSIEPSAPAPSYVFHELWVEYPLTSSFGEVGEPRGYVGGVAEYDLIDAYAIGVFHVALFGGYELL